MQEQLTLDDYMQPKNKREQVLDFIKQKGHCRTSDVIKFGLFIRHTRAERDARDYAKTGLIRRMDDLRARELYGDIREDVWEWTGGVNGLSES